MHSTHPQRMKLDFSSLSPQMLHREPTFPPTFSGSRYVGFTVIPRLWHSGGRVGQPQHVNIWESVLWVREMFSPPTGRDEGLLLAFLPGGSDQTPSLLLPGQAQLVPFGIHCFYWKVEQERAQLCHRWTQSLRCTEFIKKWLWTLTLILEFQLFTHPLPLKSNEIQTT